MKKSDPTVEKSDRRSAAELKWAKRWIRRARGGPSEGLISKMASDEPGYEISTPESGPRVHTRAHTPACGRQAVGEEWRVAACGELFFGGVSSDKIGLVCLGI